jgi:hypothetical protein
LPTPASNSTEDVLLEAAPRYAIAELAPYAYGFVLRRRVIVEEAVTEVDGARRTGY